MWEANSLSMHIANNLQRSFELKQHRLRHKNFSRLVDERMDLLLLQGNLGSLDHTRKLGFQQLPLSPQTPSPTARARQRVLVHTSLSPCTSDALHPRGVRNRCCLLLYPKSAYSTTPSENVPHTTPPPPPATAVAPAAITAASVRDIKNLWISNPYLGMRCHHIILRLACSRCERHRWQG